MQRYHIRKNGHIWMAQSREKQINKRYIWRQYMFKNGQDHRFHQQYHVIFAKRALRLRLAILPQ